MNGLGSGPQTQYQGAARSDVGCLTSHPQTDGYNCNSFERQADDLTGIISSSLKIEHYPCWRMVARI